MVSSRFSRFLSAEWSFQLALYVITFWFVSYAQAHVVGKQIYLPLGKVVLIGRVYKEDFYKKFVNR